MSLLNLISSKAEIKNDPKAQKEERESLKLTVGGSIPPRVEKENNE